MKRNVYILSCLLMIFSIISLQACKDEDETVAEPTVQATVSGYAPADVEVISEGTSMRIRIPSLDANGSATDVGKLAITFSILNGSLVNYDNGDVNNFTNPVNIQIEDNNGKVISYTVKVEVYEYVSPVIKIKNVRVEGVTLAADALTLAGHKVFIKIPTLTDAFQATDYTKLKIYYLVDDGTAGGRELGDGTVTNYSPTDGISVKLTLDDKIETFQVKVLQVYEDRGPNKDVVLPFSPINLTWKEVTGENLGEGLKLFHVDQLKPGDATNKASGYYAELTLSSASQSKLDLGFTSGTVQNIKTWYTGASATEKPMIITNAGFFSGTTSLSLVISNSILRTPNIASFSRPLNGVNTAYTPTRSAFGIMSDGSVEVNWVYSSEGKTYAFETPVRNAMDYAPLPSPMHNAFAPIRKLWKPVLAIGGAPLLIKNGNIVCTEKAEICNQFEGNRARTAIGVTADKKIILITLDEKPAPVQGWTMAEVAQIMKTLGCVQAINLDGGGSTAMVVNGTIRNTPSDTASDGDSRAIPTALMIKKK